jgi:hypothetical protein
MSSETLVAKSNFEIASLRGLAVRFKLLPFIVGFGHRGIY